MTEFYKIGEKLIAVVRDGRPVGIVNEAELPTHGVKPRNLPDVRVSLDFTGMGGFKGEPSGRLPGHTLVLPAVYWFGIYMRLADRFKPTTAMDRAHRVCGLFAPEARDAFAWLVAAKFDPERAVAAAPGDRAYFVRCIVEQTLRHADLSGAP